MQILFLNLFATAAQRNDPTVLFHSFDCRKAVVTNDYPVADFCINRVIGALRFLRGAFQRWREMQYPAVCCPPLLGWKSECDHFEAVSPPRLALTKPTINPPFSFLEGALLGGCLC